MVIDRIEIVTEYKHLQIRFVDQSGEYHRTSVICGDFETAEALGSEVLAVANANWTPEIIAAYLASLPQD